MAWVWFIICVILAVLLALEWKFEWIFEIKQFLGLLPKE